MFCIHCGAPNPGDAAFCSACGKAIAAPGEQPAAPMQHPPQALAEPAAPVQTSPVASVPVAPVRRSHALRNLALIAVLIVLVIAIAVALRPPSPQASLEKAGAALIDQDSQTFDRYVDVQSILSDWTDQAASSALGNNQSAEGVLVANGLVAGFKSLVLPKLASSVEQQIFSRQVSEQTQTDGSDSTANYMTGLLSNGIRTVITSQLKYQGVAAQTKSETEAVLDVRFTAPISSQPLIVQVRMQRMGDHWRVVAIPNVAGLLAQLRPASSVSSQGSESPQTVPQSSAESAQQPEEAAPSSPPAAVTPSAAPPLPPPATTDQPADDPVGSGGFITPPSQ